MLYYTDLETSFNYKTVVVIGKFDGVHAGHKHLFTVAKEIAKNNNLKVVAFTFDRNITGKKVITTRKERSILLERAGVDIVCEYSFRDICNMECESFVKDLLCDRLNAYCIVAGSDCGFGKNRRGNSSVLKELSKKYAYEAVILDKINMYDSQISSTCIRGLLSEGRIEEANALLGHPFIIYEKVIKGNQLGRTWDFPTINMLCDEDKVLPPNGVYAAKVIIDGNRYVGVTNIGKKPTVNSDNSIILAETYIVDFAGDLYGKYVELELYSYIRPERRFEGFDELKNQISIDTQRAKQYFLS